MLNNSNAKLMDRPARDGGGKLTGGMRTRPTFDVMLDPTAMTAELEPYRFTPAYVDECWAGRGDYDPLATTVYLRFTSEAEARAKLAKHLKVDDAGV